jgi:hypothetical protein
VDVEWRDFRDGVECSTHHVRQLRVRKRLVSGRRGIFGHRAFGLTRIDKYLADRLEIGRRNGFHMSITAKRIPLHFRGPSHWKKRSMLFSDRSVPPNQIGLPRIRSLTMMR